jgi:hypothetical protein
MDPTGIATIEALQLCRSVTSCQNGVRETRETPTACSAYFFTEHSLFLPNSISSLVILGWSRNGGGGAATRGRARRSGASGRVLTTGTAISRREASTKGQVNAAVDAALLLGGPW